MNSVARIEMLQPGVVLVTFRDGVDVSEADASQIIRDIREVAGRQLHGNLIDIRPLTYMSREARAVFASATGADVVGVAIIVNSAVQRGLGNFYLTVLRPRVPTRMFESEAEATTWLRELISTHQQRSAGAQAR